MAKKRCLIRGLTCTVGKWHRPLINAASHHKSRSLTAALSFCCCTVARPLRRAESKRARLSSHKMRFASTFFVHMLLLQSILAFTILNIEGGNTSSLLVRTPQLIGTSFTTQMLT